MLSRFRTQTNDNRSLLLTTLKGLDIHPRYKLAGVPGHEEISVKVDEEQINVILNVEKHADVDLKRKPPTNCYCYEVLLITWSKGGDTPKCSRQLSEWIYPQKGKPEFEFSFENKGDILHWMVCVRKNNGFNNKSVSLKLEGMRIIEVGTFDETDIELLKIITEEEMKKKLASVQEEVEMPRVKPKKMN